MIGNFDEELVAAELVAGLLDGRPERRDVPGAPPRTHDYDIHLSDGRVVALEITSSATATLKSMWAAISKEGWDAPTLRHSWTLILREPSETYEPDIKQLRRKAASHLEILEHADVERFSPSWDRPRGVEVWKALQGLASLGVTDGASWSVEGEPPKIVPGSASGVGFGAPYALNRAVEKAVTENLEKLRESGRDELHLFVWLDWTDLGAQYNLMRGRMPDRPPELPSDIGVVWVAPYAIYGAPGAQPPWLWKATSEAWLSTLD